MKRIEESYKWCQRILLTLLLMFGMTLYMHAADNLTSVDQIVEGKWYNVKCVFTNYTEKLSCKGLGQKLQSDVLDGGCEKWMFEKTDDGHYYLHNFYDAYISADNELVFTSTKADAVKLDISLADSGNGTFVIQKVSDSTYLATQGYYTMYYWSSSRYSGALTYYISEAESHTTSSSSISIPTTCQLQEGETIDLIYHDVIDISQLKWKSNDENVATVDKYGIVKALKEGETVIIVNDTVTGKSAFSHVTVKNNTCEHEFDPEHDIMVKYYGGDMYSQMLFGSGYAKFLKEYSSQWDNYQQCYFDIYVDGVKKEDIQPSEYNFWKSNGKELFYDTYKTDFTYGNGIHTVILTPKTYADGECYTSFISIPDSMFCERWDVVIDDDGNKDNLYSGPNIVELHLPSSVTNIGNYNGYYCPKLKDIYYYGVSEEYGSLYISEKAFYYDGDYEYYSCGQDVYGEKILHVKSDASANLVNWILLDPDKCGYRLKAMDNPDQKVWIGGNDEKLLVGQTFSAYSVPSYVPIKYVCSNDDILTPTKYGLEAKQLGKTTVTVCAADGSPAVKTFEVEVVDDLNPVKVETVTITPSEVTINANQITTLSVSYLPDNAGKKNVTWASSDNNVAMVSNGTVVGIAEGTCTIIATATDGGGAVGECKVTVLAPSAIEDVDAGNMEVMLSDRHISVLGIASDAPVFIANAIGSTIYRGTGHEIDLPSSGIYIIKVKGQTYKISVK